MVCLAVGAHPRAGTGEWVSRVVVLVLVPALEGLADTKGSKLCLLRSQCPNHRMLPPVRAAGMGWGSWRALPSPFWLRRWLFDDIGDGLAMEVISGS